MPSNTRKAGSSLANWAFEPAERKHLKFVENATVNKVYFFGNENFCRLSVGKQRGKPSAKEHIQNPFAESGKVFE